MDIDNPDPQEIRRLWREAQLRGHQGLSQYREASAASTATMQAMSDRESSASTMRGTPDVPWLRTTESELFIDDRMDTESPGAARPPSVDPDQCTFIVATDFGTTFSSVAFAKCQHGQLNDPQVIHNYPDDPMRNGAKSFEVPTESWYPRRLTGKDEIEKPFLGTNTQDSFEDIFDDDDDSDVGGEEDEESDNALGITSQRVRKKQNGSAEEDTEASGDVQMGDEGSAIDMNGEKNGRNLIWGYGIQDMMRFPNMDRTHFQHIIRSKLLLDDSLKTQSARHDLRSPLNHLKRQGIIKKDEDVIAHYLAELFLHAKMQLTLNHDFSDACAVEHVLCVPNQWSAKACRTMQTAMQKAIQDSTFGSLNNLFIITEPEAAATFVLQNNNVTKINFGETFVIVDAGGGTVDVATYTVHNQQPLRLKREEVPATSGFIGSSFLNEDFRKHISDRLKDETYLDTEVMTRQILIDRAVLEFENKLKRMIDICYKVRKRPIPIQGLREDSGKRFIDNGIMIEHTDLVSIFKPTLKQVASLMREQLRLAIGAGCVIHKVILVGGFAASQSLRSYLKKQLEKFLSKREGHIELVAPDTVSYYETAVSLGAVYRALEKENGPERIVQSSYGFLRTEPHEPEVLSAHKGIRPSIDKLDGKKYVEGTIDWLVKKGETLPYHQEYSITVLHTFSTKRTTFKCEEILYVSDESTESHYRKTHTKNRKAEEAGSIVADMSFLVNEGIIQESDPDRGLKGKKHYKIEFELVMIIDGRNLRYEARYPAGGEVQGSGQISIAAAFEPGVD